ncbi:MAG: tRNA-Thr(GGU) m(6)t(6)A37 methyltransferase TsaA [Methanolinea sp. SDB]|nr:MAG: tRNA-Thr(GGU) m(6)t(6)A37 methyltransferase TsaA [Methanolinea sp. SDB]
MEGTTLNKDITLRPVGIVRNTIKEPFLVAGADGLSMRGELHDNMKRVHSSQAESSEIVIRNDLAGILDGIEEYSHIIVLYWAHKVQESRRTLTKVHPMGRKDYPIQGIFSTCSPARPNPVLMTVARLKERKGNVLTVTGLDAVDGSPVIDIKPYVGRFYPDEDIRIPDWMQQIQREVAQVKSQVDMI